MTDTEARLCVGITLRGDKAHECLQQIRADDEEWYIDLSVGEVRLKGKVSGYSFDAETPEITFRYFPDTETDQL